MNTTPQGWYRDPADQARVRWFDGQTWTANTLPAPEPGSAPPPPPAPAVARVPEAPVATARPRTSAATVSERAVEVPTSHAPAAMVVPLLEPDDPDEYVDERVDEEPEPALSAPVEPEPAVEQQPSQYGDDFRPGTQPAGAPYAAPAAQYGDEYRPAAQPAEAPYAAPAAQYGDEYRPATRPAEAPHAAPAPQYGDEYRPAAQPAEAPYAAPAAQYGDAYRPAAAAPQYGAEYAPSASQQPELPPYVPQAQPSAFGQQPAGYPQAGYPQAPPAGYPQAPAGYPAAPTGYPQGAPMGYPSQGPVPGWQANGPQQWGAPVETKKKSNTKVVLIVVCAVAAALIGVSILAAIALPVFLDQRAKAAVAELGLDAVTCEQVATYAVQVSSAGQAQGTEPLISMTDVALLQDNRAAVRVPAAGEEPAFVLSCAGTGTRSDGTTAAVTANLFVDSNSQQLVAYGWDE